MPFACGVALGELLPDSMLPDPEQAADHVAVPGDRAVDLLDKIVATVVRDMNFMRRNVGQVIVATAIIEDTIGWIIIAMIFGLRARVTSMH